MMGASDSRSPGELRRTLGKGFPLDFIARVEGGLGIDVIIVPLEGSGYSLTLGGKPVIVLPASRNWFRSTFTLAHELGHLFDPRADPGDGADPRPAENAANSYAAELLMPCELMRRQPWSSAADVATAVWGLGVSTHALRTRLSYLRLEVPSEAKGALNMATPTLLSAYLPESVATPDEVTLRGVAWATRRFPAHLLTSLRLAVEQGKAPQASLDWALGITPEEDAGAEEDDEAVPTPDVLDELDLELLGDLG
ncbi:ImmA/IrrE family metallo-endopeptidase [Actinomyces timonensis]|uniref:ImmA/IrrE family metallo-endopeptidase n=1 Tax=Actinomyces timonensis TaxID=1288391 RepID=UPI0002F1A09B|nr:ImmA/IrrE family metallo-endopeptidase [Actinomyces timonensis]